MRNHHFDLHKGHDPEWLSCFFPFLLIIFLVSSLLPAVFLVSALFLGYLPWRNVSSILPIIYHVILFLLVTFSCYFLLLYLFIFFLYIWFLFSFSGVGQMVVVVFEL